MTQEAHCYFSTRHLQMLSWAPSDLYLATILSTIVRVHKELPDNSTTIANSDVFWVKYDPSQKIENVMTLVPEALESQLKSNIWLLVEGPEIIEELLRYASCLFNKGDLDDPATQLSAIDLQSFMVCVSLATQLGEFLEAHSDFSLQEIANEVVLGPDRYDPLLQYIIISKGAESISNSICGNF